ncbi:hypothetical protein D3C78_1633860 [compost metagenome]
MAEQVVERQGAQLLLGGTDQPLIAEAQRHAPQAGHRLDVRLALLVVDEYALAALDHQRPLLLVQAGVGVGVQLELDIGAGERGKRLFHGYSRGKAGDAACVTRRC